MKPRPSWFLVLMAVAASAARADEPAIPVEALVDWQHANDMGWMALSRGELDIAASRFRLAIQALRPHQRHPRVRPLFLRSHLDFIQVLLRQGRFAEAEPLALWVWKINQTHKDAKAEEIARAGRLLAEVQQGLGRPSESEATLRQSVDVIDSRMGKYRIELVPNLERLADLLVAQKKDRDAATQFARALRLRELHTERLLNEAMQKEDSLNYVDPFSDARAVSLTAIAQKAQELREKSVKSKGGIRLINRYAECLQRLNQPKDAAALAEKSREIRAELDSGRFGPSR